MGTGSAPRHGLSPFLPLDVGETRGWLQGAGPAPRELVGTGLRLSLVPFDETALRGLREPGHSPGLRALRARPPPALVHVVACPPFQVTGRAGRRCVVRSPQLPVPAVRSLVPAHRTGRTHTLLPTSYAVHLGRAAMGRPPCEEALP